MTKPTPDVERVARAICPKLKPWIDDLAVIQTGKCDCAGRIKTPYGGGETLCFRAANEIATAAIEELMKPSEAMLKAAKDSWDPLCRANDIRQAMCRAALGKDGEG